MVRIVDPAEPALRPVRPNIPLNIALGIMVGLVMGVGLAFFIEYLDTSVKTIDDVERSLCAPVPGLSGHAPLMAPFVHRHSGSPALGSHPDKIAVCCEYLRIGGEFRWKVGDVIAGGLELP